MATNIIASVGAARCLHIQGPQVRQPQLQLRSRKKASGRARAVSEIVEASQSVQAAPELTWQIWAGAIAGVTPFVVAGIEFSKRIAAQQRCAVCGGSGLVKKSGSYFRCGNCGSRPIKVWVMNKVLWGVVVLAKLPLIHPKQKKTFFMTNLRRILTVVLVAKVFQRMTEMLHLLIF